MLSQIALVRGAGWTIGSHLVSFLFRFLSNIVLARLLAPEIFGAMLIINSVKLGMELISDIGIQQNIVFSPKADDPDFHHTAWTIQIIRGVLLFIIFAAAAVPIAQFYDIPVLAMQVSAASSLFVGATSLSLAFGLKRMNFASRNLFDAGVDIVSLLLQIGLAYLYPTIWSLVVGGVLASAIRTGASFLLPGPRHRLALSWRHARDIINFGKWIFLSTLVFFACSNIDRLYLGSVAPLAALGVYGIARTIADLPATLAVRLSHFVVFPLVSSTQLGRAALRRQTASLRWASLALPAAGLAVVIGWADMAVELIYDSRYQDAGWMLPILLMGVWMAILCSINEAALLGFGKPRYGAFANMLKLIYLAAGLPIAYATFGLLGAIVLIAASDIIRYVPLIAAQKREEFAFLKQDFFSTVLMLALLAAIVLLRNTLGFGTPFDNVPIGR